MNNISTFVRRLNNATAVKNGYKFQIDSKVIAVTDKHGAYNYKPQPMVMSHGQGCFVWDTFGKKYYDFIGGQGSLNQGHCHPRIIQALIDQAKELTLSTRTYYNKPFEDFTKYVTELLGYDKVLPMNSGTEGGETACKLAKKWGYSVKKILPNQAKIIYAKNNYWGRSMAAVSSSSDPSCYEGFGPYLPGIVMVDFDNLEALEEACKDPNVCAFMVEPIQGEAGINVPKDGYLKGVREITKRHNVLYIDDEVQTGLGRTGKRLCADHENVRPDMVIIAKSLSGGTLPISCVLADDEIMNTIPPGVHTSTFGGNPLASRVALEALKVLEEEKLADKAQYLGEIFRSELRKINPKYISCVRGKGLLNAIVVQNDYDGEAIVRRLLENGILCKTTHGDKIRFFPALVISEEELLESTSIIRETIESF